MDWEDVQDAFGCLLWVIVIGLIIVICTVGPGVLNALQRWSESL